MHMVETTRVVLNKIEHHIVSAVLGGSSSSKLLANGFSNKAYLFLIKGRTKVIKIKSSCIRQARS